MGMATFLPLGFLTGYAMSWVMKKLNILRVPPEVELMGLDVAEYEPNLYLPEVAAAEEQIVEPDGTSVTAVTVLTAARDEVKA
jgi:Amt family ammonium transporter